MERFFFCNIKNSLERSYKSHIQDSFFTKKVGKS